MSIQAWLGDLPKQRFVAEYFHKLPYSQRSGAEDVSRLGDWQALDRVLEADDVDAMVVQRGRRSETAAPRSADEAQALLAGGATVLIRHAERHHEELARLARGFEADFAAPVNIHVYATPGGQFGFGWHYDAEDVFILQTAGSKEYALRKNTVNPWPLEETLPDDMRYERELMPLMKCLLTAGDWLYIPAGYWHMAKAQGDEAAISLAVGVMSRTAVDVYDRLRSRLLDSLMWRQRLPVAGAAAAGDERQLREQYRALLAQLADDFRQMIEREDFLDELLDHNAGDPNA